MVEVGHARGQDPSERGQSDADKLARFHLAVADHPVQQQSQGWPDRHQHRAEAGADDAERVEQRDIADGQTDHTRQQDVDEAHPAEVPRPDLAAQGNVQDQHQQQCGQHSEPIHRQPTCRATGDAEGHAADGKAECRGQCCEFSDALHDQIGGKSDTRRDKRQRPAMAILWPLCDALPSVNAKT